MGFYVYVMRCVVRRGVGEAKEIHGGGGMKMCRRQYQEGRMHRM